MMSNKILIVYHIADIDGRLSRTLIERSAKSMGSEVVSMGLHNHQRNVDEMVLAEFDGIVVTDFSLAPEQMSKLNNEDKLTWFDHHEMSIKTAFSHGYADCPGARDTRHSAVGLVNQYFSSSLTRPNNKLSEICYLSELYDLWQTDKDHFKRALCLNYFLMSFTETELYKLLNDLMDDPANHPLDLMQMVLIGERIRASHINTLDFTIPAKGNINGVPCLCVNSTLNELSEMQREEEILMYYTLQGANVKCSLRSKTINVAEIAKTFEGGGHPNAAGFNCDLHVLQSILQP